MTLRNIFFGFACGAASCAAVAAVSPNDCAGETDSARLEAAIASATAAGGCREVVIPRRNARTGADVWLLDRAILVPSNFTLTLSNAVVRLASGVQDNIVRNAGTASDPLEGNAQVTLRGLGTSTLSGGTGVSHFTPAGDKSGWRTIGVLFYKVTDFTIENLTLENTQAWAISLENGCAHGTVRNIHFSLSNSIPNQDGVDVRKGCHDITIENLTGTTGDDSVAITGLRATDDPSQASTTGMQIGNRYPAESDDIYDIRIRNVFTTCSGGHGVIRLLNHDGIKLHDVSVVNVVEPAGGTRSSRGIMVGDSNYASMRASVLGETYNVFVTNFQSYAANVVLIGGTLSNAVFQSVTSLGTGAPLTVTGSATQDVVFCEAAASGVGTATQLDNAVFELDLRADGTCDQFEAKGDLVLAGTCRVEPLVAADELRAAAHARYTIGTWAGSCTGTLVLDEDFVQYWRLVKDENQKAFRLVPFDGAVIILR